MLELPVFLASCDDEFPDLIMFCIGKAFHLILFSTYYSVLLCTSLFLHVYKNIYVCKCSHNSQSFCIYSFLLLKHLTIDVSNFMFVASTVHTGIYCQSILYTHLSLRSLIFVCTKDLARLELTFIVAITLWIYG